MREDHPRNTFFLLMVFAILVLPVSSVSAAQDTDIKGFEDDQEDIKQPKKWITADHSKFSRLQQDFTSGPEVTAVCLNCHNQAGKQVSESIHWTWLCPADPTGRMGKNGVTLNNF